LLAIPVAILIESWWSFPAMFLVGYLIGYFVTPCYIGAIEKIIH